MGSMIDKDVARLTFAVFFARCRWRCRGCYDKRCAPIAASEKLDCVLLRKEPFGQHQFIC